MNSSISGAQTIYNLIILFGFKIYTKKSATLQTILLRFQQAKEHFNQVTTICLNYEHFSKITGISTKLRRLNSNYDNFNDITIKSASLRPFQLNHDHFKKLRRFQQNYDGFNKILEISTKFWKFQPNFHIK